MELLDISVTPKECLFVEDKALKLFFTIKERNLELNGKEMFLLKKIQPLM